MLEMFETIGRASVGSLWLPVIGWSLLSLVVLGALRLIPDRFARLHHDLRIALLAALPLGFFLAAVAPTGSAAIFAGILPEASVYASGSPSTPVSSFESFPALLGAITLACALMAVSFLFAIFGAAIRLRALLRSSSEAPAEAVQMAGDIAREMGISRPLQVRLSHQTATPFVTGIRTPVIVLPQIALDEEQIRMILLHELGHVSNGDVPAALIGRLATALFAFNPLVHFIERRAHYYREASCDEIVVRQIPRKPYAETLLTFAGRRTLMPALAMTSTSSQLKQRITAMTLSDVSSTLRGGKALAVALLAVATIFTACSDSSTYVVEPDVAPAPPARVDGQGPLAAGDLPQDVFVVVEEMPKPEGGMEGLMGSIKYPAVAKEAGIEGRVVVGFIVNKDGSVSDAEVVKGVHEALDAEALRAVEAATFEPGLQRGQAVRVHLKLPVTFRLQ